MDPNYSHEKQTKKMIERLYAMADSDEGIPKVCPCGGRIVVETSYTESVPRRRYFTCQMFENDGLHRRKYWDDAVEQELNMLRNEVEEQKRTIRRLDLQIEQMRVEMQNLSNVNVK